MSDDRNGDGNLPAGGDGELPEVRDGQGEPLEGPNDSLLPQEIQVILEELPPELRDRVGQLITLSVATSYSGLMPPAQMAERYERLRPGTIDDFVDMAREEQGTKRSVLMGRMHNERLTVLVAGVGVLGLTAVAIVAVLAGQPYVAGLVAGLTGLASAVLLAARALPRRKDSD